MTVLPIRRGLGAVVGTNFSDPTNERLIFLSAAGLAVVGIALLVGTILWWRRGRQEHPSLAPLEVLGSRAWTKAPEGERQRRLERVRVHEPGAAPDEPVRSEPLDLQAMGRSDPQAFDDLKEPGEATSVEPESNGDEPVEEAAAVADVAQSEAGKTTVEPAHPMPNGSVVPVAINDADATSVTAERPSGEPAVVPGSNP